MAESTRRNAEIRRSGEAEGRNSQNYGETSKVSESNYKSVIPEKGNELLRFVNDTSEYTEDMKKARDALASRAFFVF